MKTECVWIVDIDQKYSPSVPQAGGGGGLVKRDLTCVTGYVSIEVLASSAQDASDLGWAHIKTLNISNASVRGVYLKNVLEISAIKEEAPDFDAELQE